MKNTKQTRASGTPVSSETPPLKTFTLPGSHGSLAEFTIPAQDQRMSRDLINHICAAFPGAEVSDPWGGGHDAWKIGGKMFACIGAVQPGVAVKCASVEQAELLIDAKIAERARYFHRTWVLLPFEADPDELRHRLLASYSLVRSALPKKLQASLPPLPGTGSQH